ncbi:MAG TPA: tRNA-uridine aminocarboxypropyltransferase [Stellaceae bacterium]|nr:tRNA-uridine aminocarboxypropyltransferase [Stellaceae bacterium]
MAEPIDNRVFVLILQHPQERRHALSTAPLVVGALSRARLATGLSWPSLARALGAPADPRRWAALYLGAVHPAAAEQRRELALVDRSGAPLAEPGAVLGALDGIVLLDGSWREAKTLWWRNPWLLKLHRMVLDPPRPARLGRLRREPRPEALSTLEAVALALRHLEPGPQAADALATALGRMLAAAGGRRPRPRAP